MIYQYLSIPEQITGAQHAEVAPVKRYGVAVFVDTDPDWVGPDFTIDPADEEGLKIFRDFAAKMAEHYKNISL